MPLGVLIPGTRRRRRRSCGGTNDQGAGHDHVSRAQAASMPYERASAHGSWRTPQTGSGTYAARLMPQGAELGTRQQRQGPRGHERPYHLWRKWRRVRVAAAKPTSATRKGLLPVR